MHLFGRHLYDMETSSIRFRLGDSRKMIRLKNDEVDMHAEIISMTYKSLATQIPIRSKTALALHLIAIKHALQMEVLDSLPLFISI